MAGKKKPVLKRAIAVLIEKSLVFTCYYLSFKVKRSNKKNSIQGEPAFNGTTVLVYRRTSL